MEAPFVPGLNMDTWHLYLVRCANGSLYTGITTDIARRFEQHELGQGAKFLRGRGPLELVFQSPVGARGDALRVEHRVKSLTRKEKLDLIDGGFAIEDLKGIQAPGSDSE